MSTNNQPRQRDVVVACVETLRENDTLADEIYQDTATPTDPAKRDRIFAGHPAAKRDGPVLVSVEAVSTGSTSPKAGVYYNGHRIQLSIDYAESYFERHGVLSMHATHDHCIAALENGPAPMQYPDGVEGGGMIDGAENGYRRMVADFRVTTIHACKS